MKTVNKKIEFYQKYSELRKKAEVLRSQSDPSDYQHLFHIEKDIQKLIEQLEISYTELDLQNEVLKETQNQLELSREYYNELFQYAPIGYMTLNTSGVINNINLNAAKILGMEIDQLKGTLFQSFIPVNTFINYDKCLQRLLSQRYPQSCELLINVNLETKVWVRLHFWLHDINHQLEKEIFCAIMDISHEKEINIHLEKKVKERTQALVEARKRAEDLSKTKDNFLANMSHEIRTPMNGIIGMAQMLLNTELTALQKEYAKTLIGSSETLMVIINDILDLSKIEADKLELASVPFDLRTVIDNVVRVLSPRIYEKMLEFAAIFSSKIPPHLYGDPVRVNQILLNLLSNAIKFTETGEITLKTTLKKLQEDTVVIQFEITDTGIGIPDHKKEMLFKPFSQINDSMLKKSAGTGLGLTISKKIAQRMGGDIRFKSVDQKGSIFWLTLTFHRQKRIEIHPYKKKIENIRILVIDPYAFRREVFREYLTVLGLSMDETDSGEIGCLMLEQAVTDQNPYDFCFVDPYIAVDESSLFWQFLENSTLKKSTHMIAIISPLESHAVFSGLFYDQLSRPITWTGLCRIFDDFLYNKTLDPSAQTDLSPPQKHLHQQKSILVVEDDIVNQQIIVSVLNQEGYHVVEVENGKKAIEYLKNNRCDLIIMDLLMPEMNGIDATRMIRDPSAEVYDAHIPIIAMTANAMQIHQQHCLNAGMNEFLSKPVNFELARETVKKWLFSENNTAKQKYTLNHAKEKLFDMEAMTRRMEDNHPLIQATIDLFIQNIPSIFEKLKHAIELGDVHAIKIRAHTIKGNGINISSEPLADIARDIETAARKGDIERVQSYIPSLEIMIKRIVQKISRTLN
ncbi:MAG: response regulator [Candidatus Magnetomorum sp.]|nr:response regulator [Candidatus Magnetomorum sp.]